MLFQVLQLTICPPFIDKKMEVYGSHIEEPRMELKYRQLETILYNPAYNAVRHFH